MRPDDQRPRSNSFIADARVPGHWIDVLDGLRASDETRLSIDDVQAAAAGVLVVAPSTEVASACFSELLDARLGDGFVEILGPEHLSAETARDVPAGTWVFLPHRHDGWTDLEATSARLRTLLVNENTARAQHATLTLIEYGVNLWLWAEPPHLGGDPVCHAGELSWENAWALAATSPDPAASSPRPPIYFGLPPLLRKRRRLG